MTETTGTDLLRKAALSWSVAFAQIARDLKIPIDDLNSFSRGGRLPPDTLKALARFFFQGTVEFDPAIDRLRSTNKQEPVTMGHGPDPYVPPKNAPKIYTGPPPLYPPRKPEPKVPRPGWA